LGIDLEWGPGEEDGNRICSYGCYTTSCTWVEAHGDFPQVRRLGVETVYTVDQVAELVAECEALALLAPGGSDEAELVARLLWCAQGAARAGRPLVSA
jgi:hypothetical protein